MVLSKVDPSQPNRAMPLLFDHSIDVFKSVVRWSSGIGISTALLNPNVAPNGIWPSRLVFFTWMTMLVFGVALKTTSACPMRRIVFRSKRTA